jgi:hypothetical protein
MMTPRLVRWLAWSAIGILAFAAASWLILQTNWSRVRLGRLAARQAERFLDANISVARIGGDLYSTAVLEDVVIRRDGSSIIEIGRLSVHYDVIDLVLGGRTFQRVELDSPVIASGGGSGFALSGLLKPRPPSDRESPPIRIDRLVIRNGTVVIGPEPAEVGGMRVPDRITSLAAELQITQRPGGLEVRIHRLSMYGSGPEIAVTAVTGTVLAGATDLTIDNLTVQLEDTVFTIDGTIENYDSREVARQ